VQTVEAVDVGVACDEFGKRPCFRFRKGILSRTALFDLRLPVGGEVPVEVEALFARRVFDLDTIEILN